MATVRVVISTEEHGALETFDVTDNKTDNTEQSIINLSEEVRDAIEDLFETEDV